MKDIELKKPAKGLGKECETVLRTVPDWFGIEEALLGYVNQIDSLDTYTAWHQDKLVGFFSVDYHNDVSAELHVLAVCMDYHRKGIGRSLFALIESDLKEKEFKLIQVKTVGASSGDEYYEKTRLFYSAQGFLPLEEIQDFWGKDIPCLFMVKSI